MERLPNLVPETPAPATPSAEAQELERLRQEKAQLEAQLRDRSTSYESVHNRLNEMEREMGERFRQVRQYQAPQPEPAYAAQQELGITDEEILANPKAAIERISQHIAQQQLSQYQQQNATILANQVKRGFEAEMSSLKSHPYYSDLEGLLYEHFQNNPNEMVVAGSVRQRFNELIGANLDELTRRQAERTAAQAVETEGAAPVRNRVVEPSIRVGTPPPVEAAKSQEFVLDTDPERAAAKRAIIELFNEDGLNLTEEEFVGIESGKLLPKKRSMGVQIGRERPNVEY